MAATDSKARLMMMRQASSTETLSGLATESAIVLRASSRSIDFVPPRKYSGLIRPAVTNASVSVG